MADAKPGTEQAERLAFRLQVGLGLYGLVLALRVGVRVRMGQR